MKAAVLETLGAPLKLRSDIKIPVLQRGQVLVKVHFSGVCQSQLMEIKGHRGPDRFLPHLLGHEGTGVVEALGPEITKVKDGDKVILGWIKGSGIDGGGCKYSTPEGVTINAGGVTTFNDYAVVSENRLTHLPEGVPMNVGALFGCALLTGAGLVIHDLKPKDNTTIAVFGLGGVGLSAFLATQLFHFRKVIVIDPSEQKRALGLKLGAHVALDPLKQDVRSEIMALTDQQGLDYSVESSGLASVIELAFSLVRKNGGQCVFASHPKNGDKIALDPYDLICGKNIRGSWGGGAVPDEDIPRFGELYRQGKLPLEHLLSKPYRLEEINQAVADLENQAVFRPIVSFC